MYDFFLCLCHQGPHCYSCVLDGDVHTQSKYDVLKHQFDATLNQINSSYCCKSAMNVASKSKDKLSCEEK